MARRELLVDGRTVDIQVRVSRRARTLRLVVAPGRPPEVVIPVGYRSRAVNEFLGANQRWLAGRLAELEALDERPRVLPGGPGLVCVAGEPVPVVLRAAGRSRVALESGHLVVTGAPADPGASVDRWYRAEARRRLAQAVERHAPVLGVQVSAISVRDQRTRWGSCSRNGRLSFSWRLVLSPPTVLDYVVAHELSHLREFNHSRAFWQLVESVRPDWRDQARWLREHGHELHAYRARPLPARTGSDPAGSAGTEPDRLF